MQLAMEFKKAKFYLEQEAKIILGFLIEKYDPVKKDQEFKVLVDNKYSFEYRR